MHNGAYYTQPAIFAKLRIKDGIQARRQTFFTKTKQHNRLQTNPCKWKSDVEGAEYRFISAILLLAVTPYA